jgi:branched-chain amino acid transport system permease protein
VRTLIRSASLRRLAPLLALVVAFVLPFSAVRIPGVFAGAFNEAGTLQILALCLVFASVATSYDLLFGRVGLLTFGHALFFALGAYGVTILVSKSGWPLWLAALAAVALAATLAALLGAIALRATGVAFAMVTLAFAQVGLVVVGRNPGGVTGGSDGLALDASRLPATLVGVDNTVHLYWLDLACLVVTVLVVRTLLRSPAGRVLAGIRDDERRVAVLGLNPLRFKLLAFTTAGALAGLGGVAFALTSGGASPHEASTDLTLSLLIMVVLGGSGTVRGPVIGGIVYTYLDQRLTALRGGGAGTADAGQDLWGRILSQPLLILGLVFIALVFVAPGGLGEVTRRLRRSPQS